MINKKICLGHYSGYRCCSTLQRLPLLQHTTAATAALAHYRGYRVLQPLQHTTAATACCSSLGALQPLQHTASADGTRKLLQPLQYTAYGTLQRFRALKLLQHLR